MNPYAYRTTGLAIKTLSNLLKARVQVTGGADLPEGSLIFVINHFTRIETLLMPYHIHQLTRMPVWSLADYGLFKGALGSFLESVGAVSTKNPDRDRLIVRSLLTGEAAWIIFPEGRMVKSRKIIEKGRFIVSYAGGKHPPHTGAAALALRTEFYRQRLQRMADSRPEEVRRLIDLFQIESSDPVFDRRTFIVPVNVTYYPIRARENLLSGLASRFMENLSDRFLDELMTEGTMLLSGVDVDVRIGDAIDVREYMKEAVIQKDIETPDPIGFDDPLPCLHAMRKSALHITQRYMTAIYEMTTVNPDHLFASLLRAMPRKRFHGIDLRRKVYYLASRFLSETGVCLHNSLMADQVHLITDDRFGRFNDFLDVALNKGVVRRHEGALVKDQGHFSSAFDFHRVRIDNPVAVMANEVEPLVKLQRKVRRVAWTPKGMVRRNIVSQLRRGDIEQYEQDYGEYAIEGESKPKAVGWPILVSGTSRAVGIVLMHGYMAAPLEVKELALHLGRLGYWVYVPRLRGHGTSPEDLATRSYGDWIESVDRGFALVGSICRHVVAGGFSTGAGLALDLASRIRDIRGVFAVAPPLRLQHLSAKVVPAVDVWNRLMKKVRLEGARMEFVENNPENPHINYSRNPISGVREIERLMESLEPRLADLEIPAFVAQSERDPVVDPSGSKRIFDLIGSTAKTYVLFNFERHGILLGPGAHRVHRAIGDFVNSLGLK